LANWRKVCQKVKTSLATAITKVTKFASKAKENCLEGDGLEESFQAEERSVGTPIS